MSCVFTATNDAFAETDGTKQEVEVGQEQEEKTEIPGEKFDIKVIGTTLDEASLYKMGEGERTSLTQVKGSEALRAFKNATPVKLGKSKKKPVMVGYHTANRFYRIVGRVNNDVVTNVDIENRIRFIFFSSGKQYKEKDAKLMVESVTRTLIDDELQRQYAELYSLKVDENEVDRKIQNIATNNSITVEELASKFEECGINMEIFKKHIKSRMLLQFIVQLIGDIARVTPQEIDEARIKAKSDISQKRYHLLEIALRVDEDESNEKAKERAESILRLIKDGFSFRVMAEAVSQGAYTDDVGDLGWVRQDCIEKPVLDVIKNLEVGQVSDVIKTRTGYKIVHIVDIAEPGKAGQSNTEYKVLCSKVQFQGGLLTQKDIEKLNVAITELKDVTLTAKYKEVCKKHKIEFEERDIVHPNEYELELIKQSSESKKPVIMRAIDDENSIMVMMMVDKKVPDAVVPTDRELFMKLSGMKIEKEFRRNYKKMKAMAHSCIYLERLAEVAQ
jgi:peptidyl-prolyl cis-trans isomerase SurA